MAEQTIDQGFNEKELADIMQEIETLEKELDKDKSRTSPDNSSKVDLKLVSQNENKQELLADAESGNKSDPELEELANELQLGKDSQDSSNVPIDSLRVDAPKFSSDLQNQIDQSLEEEKFSTTHVEKNVVKNKNESCFHLASSVSQDFNLDFIVKGKKVSIFVEDENKLKIQLEDGTLFLVPLK